MKHNREPWMDALETGPVPDSVQTKLNEAYASLPPRTRRRRPLAVAWRSAAALAACAAILCVTNFVNPVLAENLPVVGGLFQLLNDQPEDKKPWHVNEALEQIVVEPEQTGLEVNEQNTFPFEMKLGEAYYDGRFLGVTVQIKTEQPLPYDHYSAEPWDDSYASSPFYKDNPTRFYSFINGIKAYPQYGMGFDKMSDGSYICLMTYDLFDCYYRPTSGEAADYIENPVFPDTLDVQLNIQNLWPSYENDKGRLAGIIDGSWSADFSIGVDHSLTRTYYPNQTMNGITLEKVQLTASSTLITYSYANDAIHPHWTSTCPVDDKGNKYQLFSIDGFKDDRHHVMHIDRLEDDVKTLSFQVVDKNTDEVEAEFTFDLEHAQPAE